MILERRLTGLPEGVPLNPMQEKVAPFIGSTDNVLVSAPTASGKSTIIPMLGTKHLDEGKTIVYVGSMKALVEEKRQDWLDPEHPWFDLPKAIITGDYAYTKKKQLEIDAAKLIVITPESLASKLRQTSLEKNGWLSNVGILFVDEVHLVGEEGRGANLEAALIEFSYDFPDVPIVGLSATMPNVEELGTWFTKLNDKPTHVIRSKYRPVPLEYHVLEHYPGRAPETQAEKLRQIEHIVTQHPDDQFMICVWNKAFGNRILKRLRELEISSDFHNGNLMHATRRRIEQTFKTGNMRCLVTTKTLFVGMNLPARRVIITATSAAAKEISAAELAQAAGRAGRPRYDTQGDVYILSPWQEGDYHLERIKEGEQIVSQMQETSIVAAHFLGAMYLGRINKVDDFTDWYDRTLAQVQLRLTDADKEELLSGILSDMLSRGMITKDDWGKLKLKRRGVIAAQMLFDPYYLFDLIQNFRGYFALSNPSDVDLARILASCRPFAAQWITPEEEMVVPREIKRSVLSQYWKHATVFYKRFRGEDVPDILRSIQGQIFEDSNRVQECMVRVNNEAEMWEEEERIRLIFTRFHASCDWNRARGILGKFAKRELNELNRLGIFSLEDARRNKETVREVLSERRLKDLGLN